MSFSQRTALADLLRHKWEKENGIAGQYQAHYLTYLARWNAEKIDTELEMD